MAGKVRDRRFQVTILADRGFGDTKLFSYLEGLDFAYVIRFRGDIHVTAADGERRLAADWVGKGGRARKLRDAQMTAGEHKVGAVVCVHAEDMKEPWCLAASNGDTTPQEIIRCCSKRWTIEPGFRDTKDLRFGMGLGVLRIADPGRRDRLLLLNAFAIMLLPLLGAAGESLGMDRQLRTSTTHQRVHSLFRQAFMLYELIRNMPEARLRRFVTRFSELIYECTTFTETFDLARKMRGSLSVRTGLLPDTGLPASSFDHVTLSHVFEHLHHPRAAAAELVRILKPGGTVWFNPPNLAAKGLEIFGEHWRGREAPRHLFVVDVETFREFLSTAGFDRIEVLPQKADAVGSFRASLCMQEGTTPGHPLALEGCNKEWHARACAVDEIVSRDRSKGENLAITARKTG